MNVQAIHQAVDLLKLLSKTTKTTPAIRRDCVRLIKELTEQPRHDGGLKVGEQPLASLASGLENPFEFPIGKTPIPVVRRLMQLLDSQFGSEYKIWNFIYFEFRNHGVVNIIQKGRQKQFTFSLSDKARTITIPKLHMRTETNQDETPTPSTQS
jgi:hypothetical protein